MKHAVSARVVECLMSIKRVREDGGECYPGGLVLGHYEGYEGETYPGGLVLGLPDVVIAISISHDLRPQFTVLIGQCVDGVLSRRQLPL